MYLVSFQKYYVLFSEKQTYAKYSVIQFVWFKYYDMSSSSSMRQKCAYSEFFWSILPRIRTEYGCLLCK